VSKLLNIGIAASSQVSDSKIAERFVNSLPQNSRLIVGGYWGLMKDVADSASKRGIQVVFILPSEPKARPPQTREFISVDTGMEFRARSVLICRSCDVLVALGGEVGTMIEIFMAYAMGKPVIVLTGKGFSSDKIKACFGDTLDSRATGRIYYVDTPEEAAKLAMTLQSKDIVEMG
jgi:uncharacterized protein (TIGR00725 family)